MTNVITYESLTTGLRYQTDSCPKCGVIHYGICPFVKEIVYYPNGTVKKIVYFGGENERH